MQEQDYEYAQRHILPYMVTGDILIYERERSPQQLKHDEHQIKQYGTAISKYATIVSIDPIMDRGRYKQCLLIRMYGTKLVKEFTADLALLNCFSDAWDWIVKEYGLEEY